MQGLPEQPQLLSKWQLNTSEWNQLWAALVTAVVLVLPICLYVPLYQDDFERAVNGMYYWAGDGRPLSEFIARLLALGSPQLALTSPLGTLLCVPGMGVVCAALLSFVGASPELGSCVGHGVAVWFALFHRESVVLV